MLCEKDAKWYFLAFHGIIKKDLTDASSRAKAHQKNQIEEETGCDNSRGLKEHMMYWELLLFSVSRDQEAHV